MELRHKYDLAILLACTKMARSTFYYHEKQLEQSDKYLEIKAMIRNIYHCNKGRLGYRRMTLSLRNKGQAINHKTVYRLMGDLKLKSVIRAKKYKSYKGEEGRIAPNVLNREFKADQPGQKWATDIAEFSVSGKKLYLSPIIDLYNQEIVCYQLSERPNFKTVMSMLEKALKKVKKLPSLILHSDQGWHYQMEQYQHLLKQNGITQSMSRKGNCLDNAIIENFFGIIKSELFYLKKYNSVEDLKTDIDDYIKYYNRDRIKLNLNGMSPIQYRAHALKFNS
ncbi:MAG TPA: IS3 family transposase [Flavipsychrobacter sp.]|nr:IS3 family transposase [Flavipsychrobacter sp.]